MKPYEPITVRLVLATSEDERCVYIKVYPETMLHLQPLHRAALNSIWHIADITVLGTAIEESTISLDADHCGWLLEIVDKYVEYANKYMSHPLDIAEVYFLAANFRGQLLTPDALFTRGEISHLEEWEAIVAP